jgi:multiple sugar transport system permease protein
MRSTERGSTERESIERAMNGSLDVTQSTRSRKRGRKLLSALVYHGIVIAFGLLMLYPVLWLFASSFKGEAEIWTQVSSLIPTEWRFDNYAHGWRGFGGLSFTVFYKNSFIYAGLGTLFTVAASALVAYGFARVRFRGKRIWFTIMLLTIMLPEQVLIIPQYIIFAQLGWLNTFYPLLLPRLGGDVFFILLIVQFIRGIPIELDEAATIDGAGQGQLFFYVVLPQLKPALITAAIFSFYWTWENFLEPLVYLTDPRMYTVSVALRSFADPGGSTNWGSVFAMLALSLVPVFIVFIVFQRYIVDGIAMTGLKG